MMVSLMLKVYKTFKEGTTTKTIVTETTTIQNQNQSNQQSRNQTQLFPHNNNNTNINYNHYYDQNKKFTKFHEPLDVIFQKLVDHNLMVFPNTWPFDENQPKSKWYREDEYCKYHHIKGHDTNKCIKLKVFIQNRVDDGEIEVEGGPSSKNAKLKIFQKPFPDHNNDNTNNVNNVNQASTSNALHYDYSTNHISRFDSLCGKIEILWYNHSTGKKYFASCHSQSH